MSDQQKFKNMYNSKNKSLDYLKKRRTLILLFSKDTLINSKEFYIITKHSVSSKLINIFMDFYSSKISEVSHAHQT